MTDKLLKDFDKALADYPVMLTVTQAAVILNISRTSVYRLLDAGDLDRIRVYLTGRDKPSLRIPKRSVRELIASWVTGETT